MKLNQANIALMMIVKNESKALPRLLNSVKPLISSYRIIDTGSTDNTIEIIREALADLAGEVISKPWVNFGHNRSELVSQFPPGADFALLLDADQIVEINPDYWDLDIPDADFLQLKVVEDPITYRMPYLISTKTAAHYVGATHEYITATPAPRRTIYDGITVLHLADGGAKADKFERDEALLTAEIAAGNDLARNHFYLAQTQFSLGKISESIQNYKIAYEKSAWSEERYLACLRAGRSALAQSDSAAALIWFLRGIDVIAARGECAYEAAKVMAEIGAHQAATDLLESQINRVQRDGFILFLEDWIYDWGLANQLAVSQWWVGDRQSAKRGFEALLQNPALPEHMKTRVQQNLAKC